MQEGTVKFYDETKGFGVITAESGVEIFVHNSGLNVEIRYKDRVSLDTQEGKKGLSAINVEVID